MEFNAKATLLTKNEHDIWDESEVVISSIDSMKTIVGNDIFQVDLSKFEKVYYSPSSISKRGQISSVVIDGFGERFFMGDILLVVQCNDEKPVDISEETLKSIKERLVLY